MKQIITILAFLNTLLACNTSTQQNRRPLNLIASVDLSDSRDSSVISWYKEVIKNNILLKMGSKDQVVVLPIDYSSQTSDVEILKIALANCDFSNEYAGLQSAEVEKNNLIDTISKVIKQLDAAFDDVWRKRKESRKGTDITGALKESKKYYKEGYDNVIIVLSDMEQFTDRNKMNFEESLNTSNEIPHYLSIADSIDLSGFRILVLTGAQNKMSIEKFVTIKQFWEQYFSKSNGALIDYSSGSISKVDELFK